MRRLLPFLLVLLLCPFAIAGGEEAGGEEAAAAGGETAVAGFVMEAEPFYEMETGFREQTFGGEVGSIELTETQTLLFTLDAAERMMPSIMIMIQQAVPLSEDIDGMVNITQSILETMPRLQGEHPDTFLFNEEKAMEHEETGFNFAVGEVELWLWAQDGSGVMVPVFFYDGESGEMIDGVYLLNVVIVGPESAYYGLYNSAETVVNYMMCIEIASDRSGFQSAMVQWYLANFTEEGEEQPTEGEGETTGDASLGSIRITVKSGHARAEGNAEAEIIGTVRTGEEYKIRSISESGWFEIRLADDKQAFVSPSLGERVE